MKRWQWTSEQKSQYYQWRDKFTRFSTFRPEFEIEVIGDELAGEF